MKTQSILAALTLLFGISPAAQPKGDVCHVYSFDIEAAKKAAESFKPSGNPEQDAKVLQAGLTVFPSFETTIAEEVFTTKHFRFPQSRLTITASVFYTDESMASKMGEKGEINPESMILGIAVTGKEEENAIYDLNNNAVTEVTYDNNLSKVRVKKYVMVNKRSYMVGLECDCNAKREAKKK